MTKFFLSLILFVSGVIILLLGVIGEYVGRIYMCINNSPQYVIKERIGGDLKNDNKVNQNEFQSIVNKDINKDEIINNNNDLVESNEIQVENEAQNTNN